ncbi:albusnodin family lasso peptide [Nocardiopsis salina]|nr:albusnodin family lasso peptide [Nocardiopsis salina]
MQMASPSAVESEEMVVDLGDAADLTLGEGQSENEDKRKIYN